MTVPRRTALPTPQPVQNSTKPPPASGGTQPLIAVRQLALQGAAVIAVLSLAWPYFGLRGEPLPWPGTALAVGLVAFVLAHLTRQAPWWRLIHTVFAPLAWLFSRAGIDPAWYLLAFMLLLLFYRGAVTGRIPLYLSNEDTIAALSRRVSAFARLNFIDLGAGIGSTVIPLGKALPAHRFTGIENAPGSWLIGWLRSRRATNVDWRMGDLWQISLREFDVVYAFLSPEPMPALWQKARREMAPGSLFISNSFAVPEVDADEVIEVDDGRRTHLFCYRLPALELSRPTAQAPAS